MGDKIELLNECGFEQWYVNNAFDYVANPLGSMQCGLMRKAWHAAIAEHDVELRKQEPVPKGFIVVSKDLLAEAIACNTDASLADARHIINSVLKVSDDEIFREALKEESK